MKAVAVELMPWVWLYKQQDTGIEYISIGKLSVFSGSLQCKVTTLADNIFMSGHTASDFDGAIIYVNSKEYYATTWTDDSLFIGEIVNMSSGNAIKNIQAKNDNENIGQNSNIQKDTIDNNENSNSEKNNTDKNSCCNDSFENVSMDNTNSDNNFNNNSLENILADDVNNNSSESILADDANNDNASHDISTENKDNDNSSESISTDNTNNDDIKDDGMSISDIEAAVQKKEDNDSFGEIETQSICSSCPFKQQEKINKNFGQRILKEFPVMYPFESGCISRSVKIEPKDLGCMPIKLWAFANNRFLLHGYYCYKHLIFAGLRDGGYAIGVPGVYSESERKSAAGYSFTGFQPIGSGKVDQGVFGYWLHVI